MKFHIRRAFFLIFTLTAFSFAADLPEGTTEGDKIKLARQVGDFSTVEFVEKRTKN